MRVVRRRPLSERWKAAELDSLRGAPWDLKLKNGPAMLDATYMPDRHAVPEPILSPAVQLEPKAEHVIRGFYVTKSLLDRHGMTGGCPKCSTGEGHHSAECRARIEEAATAEAATTEAQPAPPMDVRPVALATDAGPDGRRRGRTLGRPGQEDEERKCSQRSLRGQHRGRAGQG